VSGTARPIGASPDRDEYLRRARNLVPMLRQQAAATEQLRRLPEATEQVLHESGLFRILQPARVGGAELDFTLLMDTTAELAKGCASTAWNFANLASHHWMLAMFPPPAQDEVWGPLPDALIGSSLVFPAGRAKRVAGGYRVSGHWPFSSGIDNSEWNMLAAMVAGDNPAEAPEARLFLVPSSDYQIIDTWHAMALKGTGSKDVKADDVFVPAHRSLAIAESGNGNTPGNAVNPGPLFRIAMLAVFPYVLSGVALGVALGAWEDYVAATKSRLSNYTAAKLADFQSIQIKVAEARAAIDAAALLMRSNCDEAMRYAAAGQVPDLETKTRYRRDGAFAVGLCTGAVDTLFEISGGAGLYDLSSIQRAFRDAHGVKAHILFSMDAAATLYGRVVLGLGVENTNL